MTGFRVLGGGGTGGGGPNPTDDFSLLLGHGDTNDALSDELTATFDAIYDDGNAEPLETLLLSIATYLESTATPTDVLALTFGIAQSDLNDVLADAITALSLGASETNGALTDGMSLAIAMAELTATPTDSLLFTIGIGLADANAAPTESSISVGIGMTDANAAPTEAITNISLVFTESNAAPTETLGIANITYSTAGSYTLTAPATSLVIGCRGGGMDGADGTGLTGGDGGFGGHYASATDATLTIGVGYDVVVGTRGAAGTASSWRTTVIRARGGNGTGVNTGTTVFTGGNRAAGVVAGAGGGGGGGAGNAANGGNASGATRGSGGNAGGGNGGNGGASGSNGQAGTAPGGGGGAGGTKVGGSTGGNGAVGRVVVSWTFV